MYWNKCKSIVSPSVVDRLTLTWDVLKSNLIINSEKYSIWLTLTWDVLKYALYGMSVTNTIRLTLTWDVLKSKGAEDGKATIND